MGCAVSKRKIVNKARTCAHHALHHLAHFGVAQSRLSLALKLGVGHLCNGAQRACTLVGRRPGPQTQGGAPVQWSRAHQQGRMAGRYRLTDERRQWAALVLGCPPDSTTRIHQPPFRRHQKQQTGRTLMGRHRCAQSFRRSIPTCQPNWTLPSTQLLTKQQQTGAHLDRHYGAQALPDIISCQVGIPLLEHLDLACQAVHCSGRAAVWAAVSWAALAAPGVPGTKADCEAPSGKGQRAAGRASCICWHSPARPGAPPATRANLSTMTNLPRTSGQPAMHVWPTCRARQANFPRTSGQPPATHQCGSVRPWHHRCACRRPRF